MNYVHIFSSDSQLHVWLCQQRLLEGHCETMEEEKTSWNGLLPHAIARDSAETLVCVWGGRVLAVFCTVTLTDKLWLALPNISINKQWTAPRNLWFTAYGHVSIQQWTLLQASCRLCNSLCFLVTDRLLAPLSTVLSLVPLL